MKLINSLTLNQTQRSFKDHGLSRGYSLSLILSILQSSLYKQSAVTGHPQLPQDISSLICIFLFGQWNLQIEQSAFVQKGTSQSSYLYGKIIQFLQLSILIYLASSYLRYFMSLPVFRVYVNFAQLGYSSIILCYFKFSPSLQINNRFFLVPYFNKG